MKLEDVISSKLFTTMLKCFKSFELEIIYYQHRCEITYLKFADDIVIMTESMNDLDIVPRDIDSYLAALWLALTFGDGLPAVNRKMAASSVVVLDRGNNTTCTVNLFDKRSFSNAESGIWIIMMAKMLNEGSRGRMLIVVRRGGRGRGRRG
ncbi:hypothetical protein EVAR_522_1 [Eumeta japonica]|uniref:Reverse transcriptase domain-containing protein n=1 Tax=Eumeta variegata TaxID=151549 RepID=A0A4C1SBM2_EUMVA|nr:hypothetical protein EVAR_522_1 [Eumeta japonica]